jgi:D-glycero-D-manno-heptose 1,7-bisphosphate phosphatase
MEKNRAVFLDRDGTICEEVGYLSAVEGMRLIPRSGKAIRMLNERGFKIVVVTNQAGVARGFFPESVLPELHAEMERLLQEEGAHIDGLFFCPHHPTEGTRPYRVSCDCRKPGTGLLVKAAVQFGVELTSSYMVGDHLSDVECGQRVGAQSILLLTGHGREQLDKLDSLPAAPSWIAGDLFEAVEWILNREGK